MRPLSIFAWALLALTATTADSRSGDQWVEVKSPNFNVCSDSGEKQARRVAWQFEQIRALLASHWPWARLTPSRPLIILATKGEKGLKALLPGYWEDGTQAKPLGVFLAWPDRFFIALRTDPEEGVIRKGLREVGRLVNNPYHAIYHEYVHLILDLNFGAMPRWFDEGVAEYFGDLLIEGDHVDLGLIIGKHMLQLQASPLLPVETLYHVSADSPFYNESTTAGIFYAESWALVHYLLWGAEGTEVGALNRFATLLHQGVSPDEAVHRALPPSDLLNRKLRAYVRERSKFRYQRRSMPEPETTASRYSVRRMPAAEALLMRGDFLTRQRRPRETLPLLDQALHLDPRLALAHLDLALIALQDGDRETARVSLETASRIEPDNFLIHYLSATAWLGPQADADDFARAEAGYLRAAQLNTEFAPAYVGLVFAAMQRGAGPEVTEPLARRAVTLEPSSASPHLALATVLARTSNLESARTEAERASALARTPEERLAVRLALQLVAEHEDQVIANYSSGCASGGATKCTDAALVHLRRKTSDEQVRGAGLLKKACDQDDARGCARLAALLEKGRPGVAGNPVEARPFFQKACALGEIDACRRLEDPR